MFEDATFDSRSIQRSQAPRWMLLTLAVNLAIVAAMIVLPLLFPASLPSQLLERALYVPAPPAAHAEQAAARQTLAPAASPVRDLYRMPTDIPPVISTEPMGPAPGPIGGDLGSGMPGGGDVPGATGVRSFPSTPPPLVQRAQPTTMKVSGGVLEGLLISKTTPVYPAIALTARVSGTVILAATISKEGTIENLHVLSGHPMLTGAAMDAVKTWRYRPYLLNGQPVEVETTINVVFSMGSR